MKKVLPLGLAVPVLALMGLGVRLWHLASAWEGDSGLTIPWAPASIALVALMAAAGCVTLVLAKVTAPPREGYLPRFHHRSKVLFGLFLLSGALVFKGGVDGVIQVIAQRRQGLGVSWLQLLLGVGFLALGVCLALIGAQGRKEEKRAGMGFLPLVIPGYCGCVWLVAVYQDHTANPELFEYVFLLLGVAAAILALYTMAQFSFEKKGRPVRFVWFSAMAVILLVADLADWRSAMTASVELGLALFLYGQMVLLLWRGEHPVQLKEGPPAEDAVIPAGPVETAAPERPAETAAPERSMETVTPERPGGENTQEIGERDHE